MVNPEREQEVIVSIHQALSKRSRSAFYESRCTQLVRIVLSVYTPLPLAERVDNWVFNNQMFPSLDYATHWFERVIRRVTSPVY